MFALVSACLLALPGCADKGKPLELKFPAVFDAAEVRCPPASPVIRNEFANRKVERPDHWGMASASSGELMDLVDKHEVAEVRKNAYGSQLLREYERCRGGKPAAKGKPVS